MGVVVVDHPLVKHKLGLMRVADVSVRDFRALANELSKLLTYEATKNLPSERIAVTGWAGPVEVDHISGKMVTVVPILRAGLGMMEGVLDLIPGAKVSVVGMYRNEQTLEPVTYYEKVAKQLDKRTAIILDPMLATGGTVVATIDLLKDKGCKDIKAIFIVSAPEGLARVIERHPDVDIYTAAIDQKLNENGYILPGLGDAGDKIFGTK